MYKIAKSNLPALFRAIAETKELYLPIRRAGQVNFGAWSEDAEVDVETLKTVKSPKDVFFPQSENLYSCEREGKDIKIEPQALQRIHFDNSFWKNANLSSGDIASIFSTSAKRSASLVSLDSPISSSYT